MAAKYTEALVRDQIAKAINLIDPNLTLIKKEKPIPNRIGTKGFIDIFAKDSSGRYVIIEIKRTDAAAREAAHEILKYLDGVKRHLSLRDDEVRVIVASVEWRELLLPFSSLVTRADCQVEGYKIQADESGEVLGVEKVEPLELAAERLIAPWHNLYFYADHAGAISGLISIHTIFADRGVEDYVILRLTASCEYPDGLTSTKQATMRRVIVGIAEGQGIEAKKVELPKYKEALYVAMQQLSKDGYVARLQSLGADSEELNYTLSNLEGEEQICSLHESLDGIEPYPDSDFVEIAYPAKFQARLDEGWTVAEVIRRGAFARNELLSDETIVDEIRGGQGATQQRFRKALLLGDRAQVSEAKRGIDTCLRDNSPWRIQLLSALDHACRRHPTGKAEIDVFNPSTGLLVLHQVLVSSDDQRETWVPTYSMLVSLEVAKTLYFGALVWGGHRPDFDSVLQEHFFGDISAMMFPLMSGGYTAKDVSILSSLGLRYRSFRIDIDGEKRSFYRMTEGGWKATDPLGSLDGLFEFFKSNSEFVERVAYEYGSRLDRGIVDLSGP